MSSAISAILYNLRQTNIYLGIPILIAGLIGNVLCVIVFTSLRTFRNNPCSFYLTCGTFVNIGQLLTGFLTRIMVNGFALDLTKKSLFYCKFRPWLNQACALTSLSCICLATIDQFVATSTRTSWQKRSNLKLAHRLVIVTSIIWSLHGIPYAITSDIENGSCIFYNTTFLRYYTQFYFPVLLGILPLLIMNTFSLLSLRNIKQISRRHLPIIRRELDQQLTKMVLAQVFCITITTIPFISQYTYLLNTNITDPLINMKQQFIASTLNIIWFINYSAPFYIFYCSSPRFRKQFRYVFINNYRNRRRRLIHQHNQIYPQAVSIDEPIATIKAIVAHD